MNVRKFAPIETVWNDHAVEALVDDAIIARRTRVRRPYMQIGAYNGFDRTARLKADYKIKVAIELGLIPKAMICSICGSEKGRIDYHAEDYSRPLLIAPICQGCHMILHNRFQDSRRAASWVTRIRPQLERQQVVRVR